MDETFLTIEVLEKKIDTQERSITHYVSKKSLDRGKDVVLPESLDDKNYKKNPIVLFNHNMSYPVGKSLWRKPDSEGVLAKTQFGTTPFADDIYQLNKEGILNAWSIGFIPKTWEFDEENRVTTFTGIELLEYSSVSIPMNPDAVTEGLKMVKSQYVREVFENQKREKEFELEFESFRKEIEELRELVKQRDEIIGSEYIEDLNSAEKKILELEKEIKYIKQTMGTLGKTGIGDLASSISKKLSGDVSRK